MGCRCNERREAIKRVFVQGPDLGKTQAGVLKELAFVATSTVQDARSGLRAATAAAKARLSRRR